MKKIVKKVLNYIKDEYKFLIFCSIILFLGLFHLPYNLYVGGGIISLEKRLEVENAYEQKGSINISYVRSLSATIPTYLLSYIFNWEREDIESIKVDSHDNSQAIWEREKLFLQEANDNAIISAYRLAGEDIKINKELLKILYIVEGSDTDLEIGDTLLSIDGINITQYEDLEEIIKNKNIGDKINIKYLRDNQEKQGYAVVQEIANEKKAGFYLMKLFDYDVNKKVTLKFNNREGGSSAGFMVSLAIYNQLTKFDITKGRKIVGTGTIDSEGHVGSIGGVKYKLSGAVSGNADLFFVPEENYEEALQAKKEKKYDITIVPVKTLEEAVEYLKR